jgi:hypothetical protein
MLIMVA